MKQFTTTYLPLLLGWWEAAFLQKENNTNHYGTLKMRGEFRFLLFFFNALHIWKYPFVIVELSICISNKHRLQCVFSSARITSYKRKIFFRPERGAERWDRGRKVLKFWYLEKGSIPNESIKIFLCKRYHSC